MRIRMITAGLLVTAPAALSQTTTQVALNYNFNGIVHAGEAGFPDSLTGYRSISDRGLDFSGGIPNNALLTPYSLVSSPNSLDIVHLGNRNTVDGGNWAFDVAPDGDNIGIQPVWLANVDQTVPQTTVLAAPVLLETTSTATFLYQISNGGGSFDVTFDFQSSPSVTATLSGGDWFGGVFAGTDSVDQANVGANLSITEGSVDLSAQSGDMLTAITFENATNFNAGIAILAGNIFTAPGMVAVHQIPLNYNFNGMVHAGEALMPDAPAGFRSISDRALNFAGGVPNDALLDPYTIVDTPGVLDIVHLGNRDTVDNGNWAFDAVPDGDNIGIQPTWLANVDQTGPQTTVLGTPILLSSQSSASFLYQISNGGGGFDVTFDFQSGGFVTASLSAGDWFGGAYLGTGQVDQANPDNNLSITEGNVDLSASAGEALVSITFSNQTNAIAGYAIIAANVSGADSDVGTSYCGPAVPNSTGNPGAIAAIGTDLVSANNLTLQATDLPANQFGYFLNSMTQANTFPVPNSQGVLCVGGGIGRYNLPSQIFNTGSAGEGSLVLDLTQTPVPNNPFIVAIQAGETWNFTCWYRDNNPGSTSNFTDGRTVLFQ